jgi:hypothetical protein
MRSSNQMKAWQRFRRAVANEEARNLVSQYRQLARLSLQLTKATPTNEKEVIIWSAVFPVTLPLRTYRRKRGSRNRSVGLLQLYTIG